MSTRRIERAHRKAQGSMAVFRDALEGVKAANSDLATEEAEHRAIASQHVSHADHAKVKREANQKFVNTFEALLP